jgi:hypothetical protein
MDGALADIAMTSGALYHLQVTYPVMMPSTAPPLANLITSAHTANTHVLVSMATFEYGEDAEKG